jgi:hypothetical protein
MPTPFAGETHGCYSDSLQMVLGPTGPGESVLEVLSCSPFGMSVYRDGRPFFAPGADWTPEMGIRIALDLTGWTCERSGGDPDLALAQLRQATQESPMMVGPVEMGLLPHHPGLGQPIGADHYLVALGLEGDMVLVHDPRAHPYTVLPVKKLLAAWDTTTLSYPVDPYTIRGNFRRVREVPLADSLRNLLPIAAGFIEDAESAAQAAEAAADLVASGLNTFQYFHLADFMVCVGARRRLDAAIHLGGIGCTGVARVLEQQARLIGSTQYFLVSGENAPAAEALRRLAPTFPQLRDELRKAAGR